MKVGLQIPRFTWPQGDAGIGPRLRQIARTAEAARFLSLAKITCRVHQRGPRNSIRVDPTRDGVRPQGPRQLRV